MQEAQLTQNEEPECNAVRLIIILVQIDSFGKALSE